MGTNYYLVAKNKKYTQKDFNDIRDVYQNKVEEIIQEYKNTVQNMIDQMYPTEVETLIPKIDVETAFAYMKTTYLFEYEIPDIHICKVSKGWYPLFQKNNHWSSFKEFIEFYNSNKDYLSLIDEENREIPIDEFIQTIHTWYSQSDNETHIQFQSPLNPIPEYYKDPEGYEFTTHEFS